MIFFENTLDNTTNKLYNCFDNMSIVSELQHNMRVHTYENSSGKDMIKKYLDKLSKDEQVDGYSVLQAFEENRLDELNMKPWQGKVWEVYFYNITGFFM